jgi:hypothetical protein
MDKYFPKSPFPGIDPYGYAFRNLFFARDDETRSLIQRIILYRGVLLYSDSGKGKSSLINSGLIPVALDEGYQPEVIRVQPKEGEEIIIQRISTNVSGDPPFLSSLFASDEKSKRVVLSVENFLATLREKSTTEKPLLIFDQFEEWVTLFEEGSTNQTVEQVRSAKQKIQDAIVSIINDDNLPVKVLISLREDYLAKLAPIFKLCPRLPDHYLRLTLLKPDQIYGVIRGPFEKFSGVFATEIKPSLAKKIEAQFEERMRGADIRLAEVQIVCESLFESGKKGPEIDQFFLEEGGVQGILERYLERTLDSLATDQQEPAIALLSRMITSAGTRNVISRDDLLMRVSLEESIPEELLKTTLDSLEQGTKLIRRERRREVYYYELASEFLVNWIIKKSQERKSKKEEIKLLEAQHRAEEERQRAEIQIRANKRLRGLSIALVVLVVLLGYGIYRLVSYLHGSVWEHVEYYSSFEKKRGAPVGIGRLTPDQVGRRAVSFKFIKKGHHGPVVKLIAVNSSGEPTPQHGIGTYFEPSPEGPSPLRECQYEFVTGRDGQVVYEKAYDKYDKLVWGFVYSPRGVNDPIAHAYFVGPDGYPKPKKSTAAEFIEFEYSPEGYEAIRRYFDRKGNPQLGPDKAYGQLRKFDQRGLEIEVTSLDRDGKTPMIDEAGNAGLRLTYDHLGNVEEAIAFDAKGNITTVKDGWAKVLQKYDGNGNRTEVMYFDAMGRPTLHKNWYHKMMQKYDDRGNLIEWAFFDNTGRPAIAKERYHKATAQHDARGNVTELAFFDQTGKPTLAEAGLHRLTENYDERGFLTEWAYFDERGKPTLNTKGIYKVSAKYDSRGNKTRVELYGEDGKPVVQKNGYAGWTAEYDGHGNMIRTAYFGIDGKPVLSKEGYASWKSEYDAQGNETGNAYFGIDSKPVYGKDGYAGWKSRFDGRGNVILLEYYGKEGERVFSIDGYAGWEKEYDRYCKMAKINYLGIKGKPILNRDGYASSKSRYDERGNQTEWVYFNELGKPAQHKDGYHRATAKYDARGNRIEWAYFDESGKPAQHTGGYHREIAKYDARGNRIEWAYFDESGKPAQHKDGYHRATAKYDARGNRIEWAYFDAAGKRTELGDGYHRATAKYDARGNQTEWAYFDAAGKRTELGDGYHRATVRYDKRGNRIEWAYFDEWGKPIRHKEGYHRATAKYDERGNQTEWAYFDELGKPIQLDDGYHRMIATYDNCRNLIEWAYFDEVGKPTYHKNGYHRARTKYDETRNRLRWTAYYDVTGELIVSDAAFKKLALVLQKRPEEGQLREQLFWLFDVIYACKATNDPLLMEESIIMEKALDDLGEYLKTGNQEALERATRAVERFFSIVQASMAAHQPRN